MTLQPRRVLEESLSIAAIALAWSVLSVLALSNGTVQFSVLLAGFFMAALYAVVRGVSLASDADPAYADPEVASALQENRLAVLTGGPWFLAAVLTTLLGRHALAFGLPYAGYRGGWLWTLWGVLSQAFAITGATTVLLVAVASGTCALRSAR